MENSELKKIFTNKKQRVDKNGKIIQGFKQTTFEQFLDWFNAEDFNKGCHYCGTSNERCSELYHLRPEATRGGKRGKRLELDRKNPIEPYDNLENLVWCCYWCNNAKSNFFTQIEFKKIAIAIGEVLKTI